MCRPRPRLAGESRAASGTSRRRARPRRDGNCGRPTTFDRRDRYRDWNPRVRSRAGARLVAASDLARRCTRAHGHNRGRHRRLRRRRGCHVPRADLRRAHGGRVSFGHAALAHRNCEPGVPGALCHGRDADERTCRRRRGRGRLLGRARRRAESRLMPVSRGDIERWVRYHSEISHTLTTERTALESALIPVSAYILIACVECYRRYPEIIDEINRAVPPEELGRAGHRLTTQIDPVHMWAVPNFPLVGRKVLMAAGLVDAADDARRLGTIFE